MIVNHPNLFCYMKRQPIQETAHNNQNNDLWMLLSLRTIFGLYFLI